MAADKVTFTNTKVNETISSEQRYQSHINSDGSVSLEQIASEVAGNLKDNANYVLNLLREVAEVTRRHLAAGERVLHDGLCRFELEGTGSSDTEDSVWDTSRNAIVVRAVTYDATRNAARDIVPVNTLAQVTIQLLGAQDKTTYAQNELVKGHTLLVQGRNICVTSAHEDEGFYLVKDGEAYKATVAANTAGTADLTFGDDLPVGEGYTLEIRGRGGNGLNRTLVTARINGLTVKAA